MRTGIGTKSASSATSAANHSSTLSSAPKEVSCIAVRVMESSANGVMSAAEDSTQVCLSAGHQPEGRDRQ